MKFRYNGQNLLLRDLLKMATLIKKLSDNKYLISYYDNNNKLKYKIITEWDIMEEEEYKIIKNRVNSINKLLDDSLD